MECIEEWGKKLLHVKGDQQELYRKLQEDFAGFDLCQLLDELEKFASKRKFVWDGINIEVKPFGFTLELFADFGEPLDFYIRRTFNYVGGVRRVSHDSFTLPGSMQQKGLSKEILSIFYRQYQNASIRYIDIEAGKLNGGYTWARYGFAATSRDQLYKILNDAEERDIPSDVLLVFRSVVDGFYAQVDDAFFPMETWITLPYARALLYGAHWSGILDLNNTDQVRIFEEYMRTIKES